MNWEAIGVIAELLGALGVIASLIYLAIQVRGSTQQAKHDAARSVQSKLSAAIRSVSENPSLADAYARGVKGWDHLESEAEMIQLSGLFFEFLRGYEELIKYRERGLVDEWAWTSVHSFMKSILAAKGFSDWWSIRG